MSPFSVTLKRNKCLFSLPYVLIAYTKKKSNIRLCCVMYNRKAIGNTESIFYENRSISIFCLSTKIVY